MKIWITRQPASSILFGGLERLSIWFRKPRYEFELIKEQEREMPFGDDLSITQYPYYKALGWNSDGSGNMWTGVGSNLSFGKIFGYSGGENSELAEYVWNKLCEHFKNQEFIKWEQVEKQGLAKVEDFLLEIDLDIYLKSSENFLSIMKVDELLKLQKEDIKAWLHRKARDFGGISYNQIDEFLDDYQIVQYHKLNQS